MAAIGGEVTKRVGETIAAWLARGGPTWQLVDWLRGYDLPVTDEEEPYIWIARALEASEELKKEASRFCERVEAALAARPDLDQNGLWQERALYNLFMLCACLHCPKCLARPLQTIYADRPALPVWYGLNVREALRTALAENQVDRVLEADWFSLLEERHDYFGNDFEAGFEGILKMRLSEDQLDKPVLDAALKAFVMMFDRLKSEPESGSRLGALIRMAREIDPGIAWDVLVSEHLLAFREPDLKAYRPLMNALELALNRDEISAARQAGRPSPGAAQDVVAVRVRTELKRRLQKSAGVCACGTE